MTKAIKKFTANTFWLALIIASPHLVFFFSLVLIDLVFADYSEFQATGHEITYYVASCVVAFIAFYWTTKKVPVENKDLKFSTAFVAVIVFVPAHFLFSIMTVCQLFNDCL